MFRGTSDELLCVTADHNVVCVDAHTLALTRTLIGNNDDIIDAKFIPSAALDGTSSRKLAVATNSEQVCVHCVGCFGTNSCGIGILPLGSYNGCS